MSCFEAVQGSYVGVVIRRPAVVLAFPPHEGRELQAASPAGEASALAWTVASRQVW